jgi:hypothetical protein
VINFPECLKKRGQETGEMLNGQVCHRIYEHGGNCIFDREPEFVPERHPMAPPKPKDERLTRYSAVPLKTGKTWRDGIK